MASLWRFAGVLVAFAIASASADGCASLGMIRETMLTTAPEDFEDDQGLKAATSWTEGRLRAGTQQDVRAPYLACAEHGRRRHAFSSLQDALGADAVRPVSSTTEHGACFIVSASHVEAEQAVAAAGTEDCPVWTSFSPYPSALKLAPGLLELRECAASEGNDCSAGRLSTTHGDSMRLDSVRGLMVELTPGTSAERLVQEWVDGLNSQDLDLHSSNFWSDSAIAGGHHLATAGGALRGREWSRAATVVHELGASGRTSPGDVCSWGDIDIQDTSAHVLLVSGIDHLLPSGRGLGGPTEKEAVELRVACLMGLLSYLTSKHEVLRVATWNLKRKLNMTARANIQSATVTSTPLTDAGLDGSGEVVQVVDSGLNENSCFFAHGDGGSVVHGHYFEDVGSLNSEYDSETQPASMFQTVFEGGNFTYDSSRRKVIQYIDLIKADDDSEGGASSISVDGVKYPFIAYDGFETDDDIGHGSYTAGTIAGSSLSHPAKTVACKEGMLGCAGGCVTRSTPYFGDIQRLCPTFDCRGGYTEEQCLSDDVIKTLSDHGGMAQGAKLAVVDVFHGDFSFADLAGNGIFEACLDTGCKIHANALGVDLNCMLSSLDLAYDDFMYNHPENLLVFAAGNEGQLTDRDGLCTVNSPGIAKNTLSIGSSSSGPTRLTTTAMNPGEDVGAIYYFGNDLADIDTISAFSSYGPTTDNRIKPEVVAPGDQVYSVDAQGINESCALTAKSGTSVSTAVAAGAAALVRQYLKDSKFYAADVKARGFCDSFPCDGFSPSAATVKAMLINSANLMGGSSEPSRYRGFGRIHLEAGMPLGGEGEMALFVDNGGSVRSQKHKDYLFDVNPAAGLDLRVTLSWIDPAASSISATQLVNDLDLRVFAPTKRKFCMWADQPRDKVNVNERVIVSPEDLVANGAGTWKVRVRARNLATTSQNYSLVVTGAIGPEGSLSDISP